LCHSTVAAYDRLLTSGTEDAVICGFSLGGIVAAHHADRLLAARIILFGLNPFPDDPSKTQGRLDLARDVMEKGAAAALRTRLPPLLGPDPDSARAAILAMAEVSAPDIEAQTNLALTRPGAMGALSQAHAPVLVLTGSKDQMAPTAQGQAAADAAPKGQFGLLAGLGHYALMEDPVACAQAVVAMEDSRQ
jgi:pimeloyl-ACP methyl ester carboxylesterase